MAMNKKMQNKLNAQINAELYAAYLYLSMSVHFKEKNLNGFAAWMRKQASEEREHAMKILDYLHERGASVELKPIKSPMQQWTTPLKIFQEVLKHECHVTKLINDLADLADKEHDRATGVFLQWFIEEQVEEEASASEVVEKLKMIKDSTAGILMMDREMGRSASEQS